MTGIMPYNRGQGRMKHPSGKDRDASWFLLAAAVLVLASPLRHLWAGDGRAWYGPFVVWIAIIAAAWLLVGRGQKR